MTVADLYSAPLEDFVKARDQLAKELAAAGENEEAKRVKALRKPSVTAWVLNRVVRGEPDLAAALISAHDGMRTAGTAAELRTASEDRMVAIRRIVDAAGEVSETVRKKMRSTLLAAGTDPAAEAALAEGRLEKELEPSGLGGFGIGLDLAPEPAHRPAEHRPVAEPVEQPPTARTIKARDRAERLQREADDAAAEARALRKAADRAARLADAAAERAEARRRRAEEARRNIDTG